MEPEKELPSYTIEELQGIFLVLRRNLENFKGDCMNLADGVLAHLKSGDPVPPGSRLLEQRLREVGTVLHNYSARLDEVAEVVVPEYTPDRINDMPEG